MQYVLLLQEVQERKKFEFVETVSVLCNIYTNLYIHSLHEKRIAKNYVL